MKLEEYFAPAFNRSPALRRRLSMIASAQTARNTQSQNREAEMTDDVETLRELIANHPAMDSLTRSNARIALDRIEHRLSALVPTAIQAQEMAKEQMDRCIAAEAERDSLQARIVDLTEAQGRRGIELASAKETIRQHLARVAELEKERDAALGTADDIYAKLMAERDRLRAKLERAKEVLTFYADPFGVCDESGEEVRVPDFYDEMDFWDRARFVLAELSADAPAQQTQDQDPSPPRPA
jgi:chromosome segregation ATPase